MIVQLPTALLHDVIIKSNNPSIFAASRELNALSAPVLQTPRLKSTPFTMVTWRPTFAMPNPM